MDTDRLSRPSQLCLLLYAAALLQLVQGLDRRMPSGAWVEMQLQSLLIVALTLQLLLKISESIGIHDSKIVDADSVDRRDAWVVGCVAS